MADTAGEKELKTSYDEFENEGKQIALVPEKSIVPKKEKEGLNE